MTPWHRIPIAILAGIAPAHALAWLALGAV